MVAERENREAVVQNGGVVKPIYSEREMRCLIVSESELKQIGLANLGVTVFTAIGSALISFSIDILKDVTLSPPPEAATQRMANAVDSITFWAGLGCYIIAGAVWFWRHDMIKTIRKESRGSSAGGGS